MDFWSRRKETEKIWMSLFTPQIGETSHEILPWSTRRQGVDELNDLRVMYPKLSMSRATIDGYGAPPSNPDHCIFAKTTRTITADLNTRVGPCQFGGNPDCSQCGCIASSGLNSIGKHKLPGGIRLGWIYDASVKVGNVVASMRGDN